MERVLVKTKEPEVSKAAVQEKQLLLSRPLVGLALTPRLKRSSPARAIAGRRVTGCCRAVARVIPPPTGHQAEHVSFCGFRLSFLSP